MKIEKLNKCNVSNAGIAHMYSHKMIWQQWSSDPGEGRIGVSRNRLELDERI